VSDARIAIAAELNLPEQIAFPAIAPSSNPVGFVELRERIREEGAAAPAVCDRVVANLIADARDKRSIEWLSLKSFSSGAWTHARERVPKIATAPKPARKRKTDPPPAMSSLTPEERIALANESMTTLYGSARAPPTSAKPTDESNDEQPQPKAAT
jgi:hypothetical protein